MDGKGVYGISNTNSIGIEMCLPSGTVTAKTEANTIELVQYLMKKYNIPINRVVRHYDASRKNCPAQFNLDGKWTRWFAFKAKLAGTSSSSSVTKPAKSKFKVGDKVRVKIALYKDSQGNGRSTKSVGKVGTIKRDVGKGKRYLIDNLGWAHENDIELVKTSGFDINNYHTTKFAQIKLIKDDYAYKDVSLKNKVGNKVKKGTILTVVALEYNGKYPRFKLKNGLYITTRKDTVAKYK